MSDIPTYEREPYQRELNVEVVEVDRRPMGWAAILDDTILYPEGGGQPSDTGWLDAVRVIRVDRQKGLVVHLLEDAVEPGAARLMVDWPRRYDHMQQHSAQHLLTRVALDRFGWCTRSFHIGPEVSDIELDCPPPEDSVVEALEDEVAAVISRALPIRAYRVEPEEYARLEVRSRGLPAGHAGSVRLVEVEGFDLNTCGGTHVASTAEVEALKVVGHEPLRGGCRLLWVAGKRVRRRLAADLGRLAMLRSVFDCADADLAATARLKLEQLREQRRYARQLESAVATLRAAALARSPARLLDLHLEAWESGLLRPLAEALAGTAPDRIAFLTAPAVDGFQFALVVGEECGLELARVGEIVCGILGGRGGGARQVYQGKCASLDRRRQVLVGLEDLLPI